MECAPWGSKENATLNPDLDPLILWGEDDKFQLVKYGERLASDIPGARFVRVGSARHFVMLDRPAEVADAVVSFLTKPLPDARP